MAGAPRSRVVIAGGGVAAIEALLALRDLAGDRVEAALIAPEAEFVYRPLAVATPFGLGAPPSFDLGAIADEQGAVVHRTSLAAIDAKRHVAWTAESEELPYDAALVVTGAEPRAAVAGALTYRGPEDAEGFKALIAELEGGAASSVAFAVPSGATWPLPLYELALITRARTDARVTIVTPEATPLALFGRQASAAVERLLASRGIVVHAATHPVEFADGALAVVPEGTVAAERAVALPRLHGRAPEGIPSDADGFVPVDGLGRVRGVEDVYAAGDVTDFPVKQGGVAAQQADTAAAAIAARIGASAEPEPFRPVLRGMLLTGDGARFMRAEVTGGKGERSEVSTEMLWWPEGKIAARYLTRYLANRAPSVEPDERLATDAIPVDVELAT